MQQKRKRKALGKRVGKAPGKGTWMQKLGTGMRATLSQKKSDGWRMTEAKIYKSRTSKWYQLISAGLIVIRFAWIAKSCVSSRRAVR